MDLEVVIPVRNKNIELLKNCLWSIGQARKGDYIVHMVDLGSTEQGLYSGLAKTYGLKYSRVEYHEWNKPLLLNYALKRTETPWFGVLDGDYIVEEEFFVKILENRESNSFLQCRGYEKGDKFEDIRSLKTHSEFADALIRYRMIDRLSYDYGGFQAIPTGIAKEIGGYDERFRLYGGMHCEMRTRLKNRGLKEKRLHGNPILIHQTHRKWREESIHSNSLIRKERLKHKKIIEDLEQSNRVEANTNLNDLWGEV